MKTIKPREKILIAIPRYDDIPEGFKRLGGKGGDSTNPTWDEYLDCWKLEVQPHIIAIKDAIVKHGLVGVTADKICNEIWFEVGEYAFSCTWRAWGDLMQAIVNKQEGYMAYYM